MSIGLLPLILVLVSLAIILIIIIRKFPQLALLDVDNIPEVKQEKQKEKLLLKKVDKQLDISRKSWLGRIKPFIQWLKDIQLSFRKYVGKVEREVMKQTQDENEEAEPEVVSPDEHKEAKTLVEEADRALISEDYEETEQKFISAIKINPRNEDAYKGLADVYMKQDMLDEAEETYKFLLQLNTKDELVYAKLSEISEKKGEIEKAIEYLQQAVLINDQVSARFAKLAELLKSLEQHNTALEAISQAVDLEPSNPKYLDKLAEFAIMTGDKKLAEDTYNQFRMVNPENQKLEVLKSRIDEMK